MHKLAQEALTQKVQVCNIRTCSRKTLEDGQAESEYGLLKHQKNVRSEAEALKFSWYHARSSSRSEDKKMLCTKLFDSDDIQTLFTQTSDQKQVQDDRLR